MRFGILLVLTITLFSCKSNLEQESAPENLIARDTMVMLLKDLTLIESHIQNEYLHVSRFQKTMILSGDKVLEKYHVSRERLNESMDYYGKKHTEMQSIYNEILDSLNREVTILGNGKNLPDSTAQERQKLKPGVAPIIKRKQP